MDGSTVRAPISGLVLATAVAVLPALVPAGRAEAQYRSYTFGIEAGYVALTAGTRVLPHNFGIGMFGGYKLTDNWWFSGRAMVSFPGEPTSPNTVVLLHLVPISVQYYFLTDAFRPYVGLTNSFQVLVNTVSDRPLMWGPGVTAGFEYKLRRDLFLGIKADSFMMLVFDEPDPAAVITATAQIVFFL